MWSMLYIELQYNYMSDLILIPKHITHCRQVTSLPLRNLDLRSLKCTFPDWISKKTNIIGDFLLKVVHYNLLLHKQDDVDNSPLKRFNYNQTWICTRLLPATCISSSLILSDIHRPIPVPLAKFYQNRTEVGHVVIAALIIYSSLTNLYYSWPSLVYRAEPLT